MLGYAGDSSYIGRTRESVRAHASAILKAARANRRARQQPLCFPMLGILSLCHLASTADLVQPHVEQVAGVLPLFEQYVAEEKAAINKFATRAAMDMDASPRGAGPPSTPLVDVQEAVSGQEHGEWVCVKCSGEIANLHAWHTDAALGEAPDHEPSVSPSQLLPPPSRRYICVHCLPAEEPSAHLHLAVRFYPMEQLEAIAVACTQLVAASSCPSDNAGGPALHADAAADGDHALVAAGASALESQRAEDERVELRIEELRARLPLHIVMSLPGIKPARKNPARAVAYDERRVREENRRQLQEAEAAYHSYSNSLAQQIVTIPGAVEAALTAEAAEGVMALRAGAPQSQSAEVQAIVPSSADKIDELTARMQFEDVGEVAAGALEDGALTAAEPHALSAMAVSPPANVHSSTAARPVTAASSGSSEEDPALLRPPVISAASVCASASATWLLPSVSHMHYTRCHTHDRCLALIICVCECVCVPVCL